VPTVAASDEEVRPMATQPEIVRLKITLDDVKPTVIASHRGAGVGHA
jgi:hypothetical protein